LTGGGFAWRPPAGALQSTNVGALITATGTGDLSGLRARTVAEPEWWWDTAVRTLAIPFSRPYERVLDVTDGIPWAKWFVGGELNAAEVCVDARAAADPERLALIWEGEDGEVRTWTYGELRRHVDALAFTLAGRGVGHGDAVGVFMPMLPETVAAVLAVVKIGAVFLPLFSGYGAGAVASRLNDAGAVALLTADGFLRRGAPVDMKAVADEALAGVPTVHTVVMAARLGPSLAQQGTHGGRDLPWPEPVGEEAYPTRAVDSEHTLFIAYTSGTTGRPKGTIAVHGGFTVKVAAEVAYQFDCRPGDRLFWFTDMGWIMGPWEVFGGLANGATLGLFEGAPDHPGPDRIWEFIERHAITILGISPTLVRALMAHGAGPVEQHDLSSLRVLGSTGEPWNEQPWYWYFDHVGGGRCPVINVSDGTEVGACFLSPHPVEPLKAMSLGGPALGMAVDVFDDNGRPVRGRVGELVCTAPWPGMTRGIYGDPERYLDTYWRRWPDVWVHGDWASIDEDGQWFLHGRSDDTIKVAGKRLGPAEAESAAVAHPAVVEAAAVGVPDELKGEALWIYVVLAPGVQESDELRRELAGAVADKLGKSFRPSVVRFTDALPKTRNAKVLRRAVRAAAVGEGAGDLSSLEDPAALKAIEAAR
jgi:acetyl-CoA synthetase